MKLNNSLKAKARAKEFLSCLGRGKSIYEIEAEAEE